MMNLEFGGKNMEKENFAFDGKLTAEELKILRENLVNEKQIQNIEHYLNKYKEYLCGFSDLVGDYGLPTKDFFKNIKKYGYLLENDPIKVINKKDVIFRKFTNKLIKKVGPTFLASQQIFENRNYLKNNSNIPDSGIILPKEPVIWTSNHYFKDDALGSILAAKRPTYFLFGSLPQFYNDADGATANLIGSLIVNRKVKSSKQASFEKVKRALALKTDVLWYPEGVWNKTPNQLILDLWRGIYCFANETGTKLVPIIHYVFDPTRKIDKSINPIHTVIDDPVDLTQFTEKQGLEYYRDIMATWYYLMMEKYGKWTRKELMNFYEQRAIARNVKPAELKERPLSIHEAYEIYMYDLQDQVAQYDKEIELSADYRPKSKIRPEDAFENIANIKNTTPENVWNVIEAQQIVRERKREDYQRRF